MRLALRSLLKTPAFTIIAVLTLASGIIGRAEATNKSSTEWVPNPLHEPGTPFTARATTRYSSPADGDCPNLPFRQT